MKNIASFILGLFIFISVLVNAFSSRYEYGKSSSDYHFILDRWTGEVYITSTNNSWINQKSEKRAEQLRNQKG